MESSEFLFNNIRKICLEKSSLRFPSKYLTRSSSIGIMLSFSLSLSLSPLFTKYISIYLYIYFLFKLSIDLGELVPSSVLLESYRLTGRASSLCTNEIACSWVHCRRMHRASFATREFSPCVRNLRRDGSSIFFFLQRSSDHPPFDEIQFATRAFRCNPRSRETNADR